MPIRPAPAYCPHCLVSTNRDAHCCWAMFFDGMVDGAIVILFGALFASFCILAWVRAHYGG